MEVIGSRLCRNCTNSTIEEDGGERTCRLNPPQVVGVIRASVMMKAGEPVKDANGAPVMASQTAGYETLFPRVADEWWCKKHSGLVI